MMTSDGYQLVRLASGACTIRSLAEGETFHPAIGPVAEAEALYVRQLPLAERLRRHQGEFVIWDVGLGAAANALTVLRATRDIPCAIRMISFDHIIEPLQFALNHAEALGYFTGYEQHAQMLIGFRNVAFQNARQSVNWTLHPGDFPALLTHSRSHLPNCPLEPPHAILFDPFSPAKNPAMWTLPLFANLFGLLDSQRPCALATFSRSTLSRVTLLLAGFYVGVGQATGLKEETTLAASSLELVDEPLDRCWLERVRRSDSAEPLTGPVYRQARLSAGTWEKLQAHPQFK